MHKKQEIKKMRFIDGSNTVGEWGLLKEFFIPENFLVENPSL